MPRRNIQFYQGGYYHIYNRGAGKASIFRCTENYRYLLSLLKKVAKESQISIIAYCLLPNHYHWLVRQDGEISVEQLPSRVFNSYTRAFNKMFNRSGTLFEGRYKAIPVESDEYLRHLCRYIHANPVKHSMADSVELWPYSNYLEWIGQRPGTLVDPGFVQAHFSQAGTYQAYVRSYLTGSVDMPKGVAEYLQELDP